ncbi:ATP-dependent RNA helicase ddx46-like [Folsomia candida]|nr:ATP-dependent RNA helicase ddx46-like [Folsomia candida]
MTSSPRSRSVSPKASHNLGSGRSYRSHSMDRCTEIRPRTCHQSRRESVHNSSRDTHNNNQNETNLPYHNDLPPRDQMNQGDQSSGRRSTFTPRDEYPKNSGGEIGDVMSPHDGQAIPQRQSHVAVEPEVVVPARTDYFKISKMLGQSRVKPPVEQSPSPNLPPPPSEKVQNSQNSEKLITTQKPKIILPVSEIPPNTTPEPEKLEKKVLVQHHHHAQAPEYVVPFTTGPKTHSDAKKEMKLKRQESELVACAKAKAHIDDAKKQKWEKVVQHQTRPSLTAKKVPSSSQKSGSIATHKTSSNPNNSNNKYTETTVKVRSPIGKNQVKSFNNQNNRKQHNQSSDSYHHHYNSNNTLRKDDSSGTVEVCVQIKKNSTSYQKQKKQEVVSSDEYSPNVSDDDTEEFEQLEKKVASQSLIYVDDSPKVPPPPRNFQIHNPPQSSHDLSPRERAEIKDNERVMVDFLKKNSHKLGTERVVQSFSTPMFPNCQVQPQQFASTANIIGGHEGGYRHEFFPTEAPAPNSGGYPSSINTGTGTILLAGLPIPNKSEYMHHSPRSEPSIGPGREHVFNHQFPQYQPQSVSASARPTINRGTSSHPQIQAPSQYQNYQVQGTYSIPSVMGQEQFSNCRPDTRCIFSYSNPHSSSQPINLPYYGMPGDGPSQQGIGSYHSSPSYSPQMPPVKRPPSQRRPNQKGKPTDKEISHYDPSFFTKLGTWK